jgi:hypothetical protein
VGVRDGEAILKYVYSTPDNFNGPHTSEWWQRRRQVNGACVGGPAQ